MLAMETGNMLVDAQTAFSKQLRRRRGSGALNWLRHRPRECVRLASLEEALGAAPPAHRRRAGLEAIPLESVIGTAEPAKARVFDHAFRPPQTSRRRWERIWIASRRGSSLPPISVYRLGDHHYVDDGHHRVSVARALGMAAIDAEVTVLAA
jgi:hypothetical protein